MIALLDLVRGIVFALFAFSAAIVLGTWAIRNRRIDTSGGVGRLIERMSDPIIQPIERWIRRRGGNPQNAGWWLLGGTLVSGILVVTVTEWLIRQTFRFARAGSQGPFEVVQLIVFFAAQVILLALIARVVGSWFGVGRFNRWMRPAYILTDWAVLPLRRLIPPINIPSFGPVDITPIIAWLVIQALLGWFMAI